MSYEVQVEVPVKELREFVGDVEKAIHEWKLGVLGEIKRESKSQAWGIATRRLPGGRGSYQRRIKWRDKEKGPVDYVSELYNDHQWAMAVEEGTKPHRIPSTGEKRMRAYPVLSKRGVAQAHGTGGYGTPYTYRSVYGQVFQHPGSRAFWIFRDTARHIQTVLGRIVSRVAGRLRIR